MMTKKFWNDWKKRCGDTDKIYVKNSFGTASLVYNGMFNCNPEFEFVDDEVAVTFDNFMPFTSGNQYERGLKMTLNRKNIVKVKFKKLM